MTFEQSIATCFSKYFAFSGRASRSEYWWWVLFCFLAGFVISLIDFAFFDFDIYSTEDTGPFSVLFLVVTFFPNLTVSVRRLHDINQSGWWLLWWLLILIGLIIVGAVGEDSGAVGVMVLGIVIICIWSLVWFISKGTKGDNRFGPDPLA